MEHARRLRSRRWLALATLITAMVATTRADVPATQPATVQEDSSWRTAIGLDRGVELNQRFVLLDGIVPIGVGTAGVVTDALTTIIPQAAVDRPREPAVWSPPSALPPRARWPDGAIARGTLTAVDADAETVTLGGPAAVMLRAGDDVLILSPPPLRLPIAQGRVVDAADEPTIRATPLVSGAAPAVGMAWTLRGSGPNLQSRVLRVTPTDTGYDAIVLASERDGLSVGQRVTLFDGDGFVAVGQLRELGRRFGIVAITNALHAREPAAGQRVRFEPPNARVARIFRLDDDYALADAPEDWQLAVGDALPIERRGRRVGMLTIDTIKAGYIAGPVQAAEGEAVVRWDEVIVRSGSAIPRADVSTTIDDQLLIAQPLGPAPWTVGSAVRFLTTDAVEAAFEPQHGFAIATDGKQWLIWQPRALTTDDEAE